MPRSQRYKKKNRFVAGYITYICLILIAFVIIFFNVRSTMVEYERNDAESYVVWLVEDASEKSQLGEYLEKYNFSDDRFSNADDRKSAFYKKIKNTALRAKAVQGSDNVYDVTADDKPFITIALNEIGSKTKLGILTLSDWEIDYALVRSENSSDSLKVSDDKNLDYRLVIPEGFTLQVDGTVQSNVNITETVELADFEYVAPYVDAPKGQVTELNDLYYEPDLKALNPSGDEIAFTKQTDGSYAAAADYSESEQAKELAQQICDPLNIGKLWSKFMTDDIGGTYHGLYTIRRECKLLNGTNLYNLATKWATNVDITFVSGHVIDSFTDESVTNYVLYNENLFSCDVRFNKNMTISRGLGTRVDDFANRMFFGKVDGQWYLLDMVTLE